MSRARHSEPCRQILFAATGILYLLTAGCVSSRPHIDEETVVRTWQDARKAYPYHAEDAVFVGIAVTDFPWYRDQLASWGRSRDLLAKVFQKWLHLPAGRIILLDNPGRAEMEEFFTVRLSTLPPETSLIIYLGTHYLQDGRLLLAGNGSFTAAELADWLKAIPSHQLLLTDVCYADAMESASDFPTHTSRIYASGAKEPTPEIRLRGTQSRRGVRNYFRLTQLLLKGDLDQNEDRYSLLGLSLAHSLVTLIRQRRPTITPASLYRRLSQIYAELDYTNRTYRPPRPRSAQLKDRPFAALQVTRTNWYKRFEHSLLEKDRALSITTALLTISRIYDPRLEPTAYAQQLDRMALALRRRTQGLIQPSRIIAETNKYLYRELGMQAVETPYTEDFLLHRALAERRGRCASLTAVYLALAERLDWPLTAVCIPEHIFVRWQREPGKPHINIESTDRGRILPDAFYQNRQPLPGTEDSRRFYLKALTRRQIVATYLSPLGNALRRQGRRHDAHAVLKLALKINPQDVEAWNNLGLVQVRRNDTEAARKAYQEALRIAPNFAAAWNNLGNLNGALDERLEAYRQAVKYDPELGAAWAQMSRIWLRKGNPAKAWVCAKRSRESGFQLDPKYIELLQQALNRTE